MKFNKGLFVDGSKTNQPTGTWKYLLNGVYDVEKNTITSEEGFRQFSKNLPADDIIGTVTIDDEIVLFFHGDEIGVLKENGLYERIIQSSLLNFDKNFPIKAKGLKNFNSERIITFVDDNNKPKFINLDDILYTRDLNNIITGASDLNKYLLFPEFVYPSINSTDTPKGGSLKSGTYYVIFQYEDEYSKTTNWTKQSEPFYITASQDSRVYGSDSDSLSSRSLQFDINSIDDRFIKLNIGIVSEINGTSSVVLNKTLNVASGTTSINGIRVVNNNGTTLTLEETLIDKPNYIRIKDIDLSETEFLGGNVKEEQEINFQKYANMIKIDYDYSEKTINPITVGGYIQTTGTDKGFRSGEVYAFYCSLLYDDGREGRLFHIPGRPPVGTEATDISSYVTGGANDQGIAAGTKKFRVENTSNTATALTNMGYWENEDEVYPNTDDYDSSTGTLGGLDLRGEKVRHHRFPNLKYLKENVTASAAFGIEIFPLLRIDVSNVIIDANVNSKIQGVKFYYAKRDVGNITCLGQSIYQYSQRSNGNTENTGILGNFEINSSALDGRKNDFGLLFYDFGLMNEKPEISPTYLTNHYRLNMVIPSSNEGTFLTSDIDSAFTSNGIGASPPSPPTDFRRGLFNYTDRTQGTVTVTLASATTSDYIRPITKYKYIPENVNTGNFKNFDGEEKIFIEILGTGLLSISAAAAASKWNQTDPAWTEDVLLTDLNQLLDNVYININQDRDVVHCYSTAGSYLIVSSTGTKSSANIANGDNFINFHTFSRTSNIYKDDPIVIDANNITGHISFGAKAEKIFLGESIQNHRFRYEESNSLSKYIPNTNKGEVIVAFDLYEHLPITYNNDFNQLNDNNAVIIFDENDKFTHNHPFRVVRSNNIGREDDNLTLDFAPLGYYEMPKKRGVIVGIDLIKDKLIIRHENGTYITRPKQKVITDEGDATLGSNDLFEIEPQELFTTDQGHIKSIGVYDSLVIEHGLILLDRKEGKVFLIGDKGVEDLTSPILGLNQFFLEELSTPFKDNEIKIGHALFLTSATCSTYTPDNKIKITVDLITYSAFDINSFSKGDYVWFDTDLSFGKVTKVYLDTKVFVIETDHIDATPTAAQEVTQFRKVNSPFYNNGVQLGWNKDQNTLFITKRSSGVLSSENRTRFIGKHVNSTIFTNDLNVDDIVEQVSSYMKWNGSSFNAISTEDNSFTLSYNFDLKKWVSYHSYIPNMYMYQRDRLLSYNDATNLIHKHNQKNRRGQYYSGTNNLEITLIFNTANQVSKKFISLTWVTKTLTDVFGSSGVLVSTDTFDDILCTNDIVSLGTVILVPFVDLSATGNVRNVKGTWNFNKLKDSSNNLLTDKYLSVKFRYSGTNFVSLYDVEASFRIVDKS